MNARHGPKSGASSPVAVVLVLAVVAVLPYGRSLSPAERPPDAAPVSPARVPVASPLANTYYVATDGNDAWSGLLPAPNPTHTDGPWRTIQHGAHATHPGDTLYVRQGTYAEWVWFDQSDSGTEAAPKTFAVYPGETVTLDGAAYPTAWQVQAGSIWWTDASWINFNWEGQARLVWQDDVWLQHAASVGSMTEGTWWYDTGSRRLYVWLRGSGDPRQHSMAVAALRSAFFLSIASWIVIDGFHITHYYRGISQEDPTGGRASMAGLTVRNCVVQHVGEGIGLAGATFGDWGYLFHDRLEGNVIQDTQSDALWVGAGTDHQVRGNRISDVKQAWYRGFVSGGIILGNADDSVIEANDVSYVQGLGIDIEHAPNGAYGERNIVHRNLVHDVAQHGISVLGANSTRVENNVIYNSAFFGISVITEAGPALHTRIVNNTIYHTDYAAIAIIASDANPSVVPQDTVLWNNIVSNTGNFGLQNDGTNTVANYDLYWQTPGGVALWGGVVYPTLAALQATGRELQGVSANPLFVAPGSDLRLQAGSPAIDAGTNNDAPLVDYWGDPRPVDGNGNGIAVTDIGADEWVSSLHRFDLPLEWFDR